MRYILRACVGVSRTNVLVCCSIWKKERKSKKRNDGKLKRGKFVFWLCFCALIYLWSRLDLFFILSLLRYVCVWNLISIKNMISFLFFHFLSRVHSLTVLCIEFDTLMSRFFWIETSEKCENEDFFCLR